MLSKLQILCLSCYCHCHHYYYNEECIHEVQKLKDISHYQANVQCQAASLYRLHCVDIMVWQWLLTSVIVTFGDVW